MERTIADYRANDISLSSGQSALSALYEGLSGCAPTYCPARSTEILWDKQNEAIAAWLAAYPDSAEAKLASLYTDVGYAYQALNYNEDSTNGLRYYTEAIEKLEALPKEIKALPEWSVLMLRALRYTDQDGEKLQTIFEETIGKHPYHIQAYFEVAYRTSHNPEALAYIVTVALEGTPKLGKTMYARIYWATRYGRTFDHDEISWPEMSQGFTDLLQQYPDPWNLDAYTTFACRAGDWELLLELVTRLAEVNEEHTIERFAGCVNFATESLAPDPQIVMIQDSPRDAIDQIKKQAGAVKTTNARNLLKKWVEIDELGALGAAKELDEDDYRPLVREVLINIADRDPQLALSSLETVYPEQQSELLSLVLTIWLSQSPLDVVNYVEQYPGNKIPLLRQVGEHYGKIDPEAAIKWLRTYGNPMQGTLGAILQNYAKTNVQSAESYMASVDSEYIRGQLLVALTRSKLAENPQSVSSWLDDHRDNPGHTQAAAYLFQELINEDPAMAASQIEYLEPKVAKRSVNRLMDEWSKSDLPAAESWSYQLPSGFLRDNAYRNLGDVYAMSFRDFERALIAYENIQDDKSKKNALVNILPILIRKDPSRYDEAIEKYELGEVDIQRIDATLREMPDL